MSRRKASVEVRQVIAALCSLLSATGLDPVPVPETFRRAKFGGGAEVEDQFWQLLVNILQKTGVVSSEACRQLSGEPWKLVAAGLWQTGYHADWMFEKEGGERPAGGRSASRNLLLALGWLLATGALEKLLTQQVQQLDITLFTPVLVSPPQFSRELQINLALVRKLQWLMGNLRTQQRILLSALEERTRLLHAVFAILPSSDRSLTLSQKDCLCMQRLCDLLEAYLKWKQEEKVFWTWMDSVVDSHLTDDPVIKKSTRAIRSRRMCHHGNRGLEELDNMLLRLPIGQTGQKTGRRDLEHRAGGGGGEMFWGELNNSSLPLPMPSIPSQASPLQVYRARLQTERPVKPCRHTAEGPGIQTPDELPSSQAVQLLLQTEAALRERRDRQRTASRMLLQETVGKLENLVLIPP
ncbi:tubulin epsilon and delta complex protein 1 [Antennarius striatus]|uniref:tubulin epsilon and delta complex protein 1 n=1 Tax=Antennarius striatus TaxID=241820 RepID=UPI0035B20DF6